MASFTIQRSEGTGYLYVLEYDGAQVVRRFGPVYQSDLDALTPDTLHLVEFDEEDGDEVWGIPLEYRDGEWVGRSN